MRNRLKLMAEYGCYPLWDMSTPTSNNVAPEELGLSAALSERLDRWSQSFSETLDERYPPDSGFPSREKLEEFEAEARELMRYLHAELGESWELSYATTAGVREASIKAEAMK